MVLTQLPSQTVMSNNLLISKIAPQKNKCLSELPS